MPETMSPREKVLLKPCPFCGGEAVAGSNFDNDHYVMCGADCDKCGGMVGYMKTEMAAIENWNRRAALASSGSGDHAELARLAEAATPGPWSAWIKSQTIQIDTRGGDGRLPAIINWPGFDGNDMSRRESGANARFIAAANPSVVLALLAENAALRADGEARAKAHAKEIAGLYGRANTAEGELDAVSSAIETVRFMDPPDGGDVPLSEQVRRMASALTEAERKLVEAVGLLRKFHDAWRSGCGWLPSMNALDDEITAFLSKEAERG